MGVDEAEGFAGRGHGVVLALEFAGAGEALAGEVEEVGAVDGPVAEGAVAVCGELFVSRGWGCRVLRCGGCGLGGVDRDRNMGLPGEA